MSYEISTPGSSPCRLYCERLAIEGGTVNITTDPPVITCDPVTLTVAEDSITLNETSLEYRGRTYEAGQVIEFLVVAASGIEETDGEVRIDWQSADGTIRDRSAVAVRIDDWRKAS